MSGIALAMIAMSGHVTMLGISRWTGAGGSYRTVQRFFATVVPWASLFWLFFRTHLYRQAEVYLLAGDEVVVTKAGKATHGLDRFFASLYGKAVPGLAFFALSLVSVQARHAFPMAIEQIMRSETEKAASKAKAIAKAQPPAGAKRPAGRPKGGKNKNKTAVPLTPELLRIQGLVNALWQRIAGWLPLTYLLLDGHFGHNNALQMTRQSNLHLISKLRNDSALYFPDASAYGGRGPRRKYGDKVDYRNLPDQYRQATHLDGSLQTCCYQATLLHKQFSQPLNVVIVVKTNLDTRTVAHVVLFSSDLTLSYDKLFDYYCLRFQIEFNFRDAKQFWGLEDFMNISPIAVTNAANLALFMVNLSYRLLLDFRCTRPAFSVLDLKAFARGYRYVDETIKLLPQKPDPVLLTQIFNRITALGQIHPNHPGPEPT